MMKLIEEEEQAGARRTRACEELGIHVRTLQRWRHQMEDQRPVVTRPEPCHKLNADERKGGCKKFCVNGHLVGNCHYFERSWNDRSKSTTR